MNITEFVEKYKGKPVDFDGHFGAQCVDLVRLYWECVANVPQPEGTGDRGAVVFFTEHYSRTMQSRYFERVTYRDGLVPPPGAVVVFGPVETNRYGHVGICVDANAGGIELFEQDGIANAKAIKEGRAQNGAYIGRWNYSRVLGWLVVR